MKPARFPISMYWPIIRLKGELPPRTNPAIGLPNDFSFVQVNFDRLSDFLRPSDTIDRFAGFPALNRSPVSNPERSVG